VEPVLVWGRKQTAPRRLRAGGRLVGVTCGSDVALRRRGRLVGEDRPGGVRRRFKQAWHACEAREENETDLTRQR